MTAAAPAAKATEQKIDELKVLNIADIDEAGFSLRDAQLKEPDYVELALSVKDRGVRVPIVVRPYVNSVTGKAGYQLVDGAQRMSASKEAGLKTIPCHIVSMDNTEMMRTQITCNDARVATKPCQYAALIKTFMEQPEIKGCSYKYLAAQLNMSVEKLEKYVSLGKLSEDIRAKVDAGTITAANGLALTQLKPEHQTEMLKEAATMTAEDFKVAVAEKKSEILAAARGNGAQPAVYVHRNKFRTLAELEAEITSLTAANTILKDVKDVREAFRLGLKFALTATPMDIENGKAKYEADKAAKEVAKAKAKAKAEKEAAAAAAAAAVPAKN